MEIRKAVNGNPAISAVVVLALVGVCGWFAYSQVKTTGAKAADSAYFTVDDGKTWFVDSSKKMPPFDHEGKQAVRIRMYRCADSSEKFIGYLERYTTKGKAALEKMRAEEAAKPGQMPASFGEVSSLGPAIVEVKKPGDANWSVGGSPQAFSTAQVKCKDGSTAFVSEAE